jgi:hypothetical protein
MIQSHMETSNVLGCIQSPRSTVLLSHRASALPHLEKALMDHLSATLSTSSHGTARKHTRLHRLGACPPGADYVTERLNKQLPQRCLHKQFAYRYLWRPHAVYYKAVQ